MPNWKGVMWLAAVSEVVTGQTCRSTRLEILHRELGKEPQKHVYTSEMENFRVGMKVRKNWRRGSGNDNCLILS